MAIGSMAPVVATPFVAMAEFTCEVRVGPHRSREGAGRRPALGRIEHVAQQLQDSSDTRSRLDAQPCVSVDIGLHDLPSARMVAAHLGTAAAAMWGVESYASGSQRPDVAQRAVTHA